jgi:glutaredoxin-like protein NrdH
MGRRILAGYLPLYMRPRVSLTMAVKLKHVKGKKAGDVRLYALSTCGWCKKTRELLDSLGVAYDYVYVDLLEGPESDEVSGLLEKLNPSRSFPTICIDKKKVIVGYKEDEIRKALKK